MKRLCSCLRKMKNFMSYKTRDKFLLFEVFILTGIFRMAMLYIPFKKLKVYMGEVNVESCRELKQEQYNEARRIFWVIKKIVKYTPWQSKCLVQSLTAQYLLHQRGIESTLYLGMARKSENMLKNNQDSSSKKADLIAHSWIRCGRFFVTGGNGENFTVVAKFKKGV